MRWVLFWWLIDAATGARLAGGIEEPNGGFKNGQDCIRYAMAFASLAPETETHLELACARRDDPEDRFEWTL